MKPGRELDALIAEKVMGFTVKEVGGLKYWMRPPKHTKGCGWDSYANLPVEPPHYSTDIAAAWDVVEKIHLFRDKQFTNDRKYGYRVQMWQHDNGKWTIGDFEDQLFILADEAESASHAICLAALKTL